MSRATIWFFVLLASCVLMSAPTLADDTVKLEIHRQPVAISLVFKNERGDIQSFNPQAYKLSVVHFWAIWCAPCLAELPEVDQAAKTYADKGVRFIAISMDDERSMPKIKQLYSERRITHLATYFDASNASFRASHLPGLPGTLFIDKDGKEIARAEGPLDWTSKEVTDFIVSRLK